MRWEGSDWAKQEKDANAAKGPIDRQYDSQLVAMQRMKSMNFYSSPPTLSFFDLVGVFLKSQVSTSNESSPQSSWCMRKTLEESTICLQLLEVLLTTGEEELLLPITSNCRFIVQLQFSTLCF